MRSWLCHVHRSTINHIYTYTQFSIKWTQTIFISVTVLGLMYRAFFSFTSSVSYSKCVKDVRNMRCISSDGWLAAWLAQNANVFSFNFFSPNSLPAVCVCMCARVFFRRFSEASDRKISTYLCAVALRLIRFFLNNVLKIHKEINRKPDGKKKNDFGKLRFGFAFIGECTQRKKESNFQFPSIECTVDLGMGKKKQPIFSYFSPQFFSVFYISVFDKYCAIHFRY